MTTFDLKAKFERLGPTLAIDLVPSGSCEIVTIQPGVDLRAVDTIAAILLLRRSGLTMLRSKRAIEASLADGNVLVEVPRVVEAKAFETEMRGCGFDAKVRSREVPNVQALRERLGLTQEQFATRFGLEVNAVRNWEHARRVPDTAARSLLKVIARYPDLVAKAQDG